MKQSTAQFVHSQALSFMIASFIKLRETADQKWNLQKSACDDGVKIDLRPVLTQFRANLSFPAPGMLLSGLLSTLKRCEPPKVSIVS